MKKLTTKRIFKLVLLSFLSFLISVTIFTAGFIDSWQEKIYDRLFVIEKPVTPIVVIAIDDITLEKLGPWPLKRSYYAKLVDLLPQAKAIGIDVFFAETSRYGVADDKALELSLSKAKVPLILPIEERDRGGLAVSNLKQFTPYVTEAIANIPVDNDGIARFAPVAKDARYKFLSQAVVGRDFVPERFRINYIGPEKTILTIPMLDVLDQKIPKEIFQDTYVFIGATAKSLHDTLITPFGEIPGVEVHAQIANAILENDYPKYVSSPIVLALILLIITLVFLIVWKVKSFRFISFCLLGLLVFSQGIALVAFYFNILIPQLYLLISFLLPVALLLIYVYTAESKEKQFIEQTFRYYLMPEIIEDLKNNPDKLKLGGEKRLTTILFSDIRGFTTISEKLSPDELTNLINEYLTAMTDIVMDNKGLVDKYIGDAVMAFWGAPVENTRQAHNACEAVLQMSAKLRELNKEWKEKGIPELGIGVGLNMGEVVVGNMGSSKRFNYTIMGDEVNFGSRLEGLNKMYGTECIISESVYNAVKNDPQFLIRELDSVLVKGKKEPKNIFELVTRDISEKFKECLGVYKQAYDAYKKGSWDKAEELFLKALTIDSDPTCEVFLERVRYLRAHSPENWVGVYEHKSK